MAVTSCFGTRLDAGTAGRHRQSRLSQSCKSKVSELTWERGMVALFMYRVTYTHGVEAEKHSNIKE
jgi:hypothetical protein